MSPNNVLVLTVNSVGAVFQLAYIILFIIYAEKPTKVAYIYIYVYISYNCLESISLEFPKALEVFGVIFPFQC